MADLNEETKTALTQFLEQRFKVEEMAPFQAMEHHSDHLTNLSMSEVLDVINVFLKETNKGLPYTKFPVNKKLPFKKTLSPQNLLRVFTVYIRLADLCNAGFNGWYNNNITIYRLSKINQIDLETCTISMVFDLLTAQGVVITKSRTFNVTLKDTELKWTNQYAFNPVLLNLYPKQTNNKTCKILVENIA